MAKKINDAIQGFLEKSWSDNTRRGYTYDLQRFGREFGELPVTQVTSRDIQRYLDQLTDRQGGPLQPRTYNRHHSTLRTFFNWLKDLEQVKSSPVEKVERKTVTEKAPRVMPPDLVEVFFQNIKNHQERTLFSLIYETGIKVSEALDLTVEDVDIEAGKCRISGSGNVGRVVYISETMRPLMSEQIIEREGDPTEPIFQTKRGEKLSYAMVHRMFRNYAQGLTTPDEKPVTIRMLKPSAKGQKASIVTSSQRTPAAAVDSKRLNSEETGSGQEEKIQPQLDGLTEVQLRNDVQRYLLDHGFEESDGGLFASVNYRRTIDEVVNIEVTLRKDFIRVSFHDATQKEQERIFYEAEILYSNWRSRFEEINDRWNQIKKYVL
jgi:site-specific recombinase XerD